MFVTSGQIPSLQSTPVTETVTAAALPTLLLRVSSWLTYLGSFTFRALPSSVIKTLGGFTFFFFPLNIGGAERTRGGERVKKQVRWKQWILWWNSLRRVNRIFANTPTIHCNEVHCWQGTMEPDFWMIVSISVKQTSDQGNLPDNSSGGESSFSWGMQEYLNESILCMIYQLSILHLCI